MALVRGVGLNQSYQELRNLMQQLCAHKYVLERDKKDYLAYIFQQVEGLNREQAMEAAIAFLHQSNSSVEDLSSLSLLPSKNSGSSPAFVGRARHAVTPANDPLKIVEMWPDESSGTYFIYLLGKPDKNIEIDQVYVEYVNGKPVLTEDGRKVIALMLEE